MQIELISVYIRSRTTDSTVLESTDRLDENAEIRLDMQISVEHIPLQEIRVVLCV